MRIEEFDPVGPLDRTAYDEGIDFDTLLEEFEIETPPWIENFNPDYGVWRWGRGVV